MSLYVLMPCAAAVSFWDVFVRPRWPWDLKGNPRKEPNREDR